MPHLNPAATATAPRIWRAAIAAAVLLLLPAAAWAQQSRRNPAPIAKTDTTVYTYVEQMPVMQDGGGIAEMVSYIARHTRLRHCNGPTPLPEKSRILVAFIVTETGSIRGAHIVQGISCGNDEAVLAAVRSLPQFRPGRQNGQPVAVKFVLPFTFHFQ